MAFAQNSVLHAGCLAHFPCAICTKESVMRKMVILFVLGSLLAACKSDTSSPGSGGNDPMHTSIDTRGRKGFSFSQGVVVNIPNVANIWPEFEAKFGVGDLGPRDLRAYFLATEQNDSLRRAFHFVASAPTQDGARTIYQNLSGLVDTTYTSATVDPFLAANQVWAVRTRDNRFGKLLIVANDVSPDSTYATATFDWSF